MSLVKYCPFQMKLLKKFIKIQNREDNLLSYIN